MLAEQSFDVVVTDMRMPGMDGAALLTRVRDLHPGVVRIVLSGHAEQDTALRSVPVAHQFLSKPCSPELLRATVARATQLQPRLADERLRALLGEVDTLPSPPTTVVQLMRAFRSSEPDLQEIATIIERDVATSAKVLQLVNSAFFGLGHRIAGVAHALTYLGLETVRGLVLAVATFRMFETEEALPQEWLGEFHRHSFEIADTARQVALIAGFTHDANDVFGSALLHDIGSLVLASRLPESQHEIEHRVGGKREDQVAVELDLLGATHCDIGAYLLGLWGLPPAMVSTAADHHRAPTLPLREWNATHAVYLAESLRRGEPIERGYLKELGLAGIEEDLRRSIPANVDNR
jgi:HD-like signal output (HDOD) protein